MPRFTIRDLLWLTLVVGMGMGWFVNWMNCMAKQAEAAMIWTEAMQFREEVARAAEDAGYGFYDTSSGLKLLPIKPTTGQDTAGAGPATQF